MNRDDSYDRKVSDALFGVSRLAPWRRFEQVVVVLFEALGFETSREMQFSVGERSYQVDLLATAGSVRSAVEIKAFRSRIPPLGDIHRAARVVANARQKLGTDYAVLVINLHRKSLPQPDMMPEGGVTLICLDDLVAAAIKHPQILTELTDVTRELSSGLSDFDNPLELSPAPEPTAILALRKLPTGEASPSITLPETRGQKLAEELLEIPSGADKKPQTLISGRGPAVSWRLYELVAEDSFRYIFEDELSNWRIQRSVAGEDKRFDALAKVTGADVFSRSLIEDFRSRYVLFEFKNYDAKLKPNVLYVTEKYLFPTAMRSTAIILSPKGFSDDSRETARGALRDAGKLMIDVTSKTLAEMLKAKDEGSTASAHMENLLDDFLISLGR